MAKRKDDESLPMSLEEIARRMLATPPKERAEMAKKKAKTPSKKK